MNHTNVNPGATMKSLSDFDALIAQRKAEHAQQHDVGFFPEHFAAADYFFLEAHEREIYFELLQGLPTFAEERKAARERIALRIAQRKAGLK